MKFGTPSFAASLLLLATALIAPAAQAQVLRINCGGPDATLDGQTYVADRTYAPGSFGYGGGRAIGPEFPPPVVDGTTSSAIYDDARVGNFVYRFDVAPGRYRVKLHFAEIEHHGPGLRRLRVFLEGLPLIANLDVFAKVEKDRALTQQFAVQVNDGRLDLAFMGLAGEALVSAISVSPYPAEATAPAAPTGLQARGSYHRTIVTWNEVPEADVAGYRVYRAPVQTGPFTLISGAAVHLLPYFFDDAVTPGVAAWYRVAAVDAGGNLGPRAAAVAGSPRFDASSPLPVMRITLDPEALAQLQADPFSDDDVEGSFETNGVVHEGVDIRYRGQTSRFWNKKSWKIDFPGSAQFLGVDELNLNAKPMDATLMKECTATDVLERTSALVPRCRPIHLQVNGEYRGVFSSIEEMDSAFLDRVGLDPDGSLYEATGKRPIGMSTQASLALYMEAYEKESNEGEPFDDLIAFLELVNDTPDAGFATALAGAFNVDAYLDYVASLALVADVDQVHNNYTLFHDHERDVWEMLTRDHDNTFFYNQYPLDYGTEESPGLESGTYNALLDRVLETPLFRSIYAAKVAELIQNDYAGVNLNPRISALFGQIVADGRVDVWKLGREGNNAFNAGPETLMAFAAQRRVSLANQLRGFNGGAPQPVVINEVQSSNVNGLTDEAGEHEDWVEVVNRSVQSVNLSGYGLTDKLDEPLQWVFPSGTVLGPNQRLLIWADEDGAQGPHHADFKISKGGEMLGLFKPDASLVDFVALRSLRDDASWGRRFDGSSLWTLQGTPSPGGPNTGAGNQPPNFWSVEPAEELPAAGEVNPLTAMIEDEGSVVATTLWVDTGSGFVATPLRDDGASGDESANDDLYGATLPAIQIGGTLRFYLEATDDAGLTSFDPPDGADDPYSYALEPPTVLVFVNEVMADNDATIADEAGDFEDYVELYNAGAVAVDLSGMFLSDNLGDSDKWQIPGGTVIAAGGYLLVWADQEPSEGPLHAAFGLSSGGEEIGLFQTLANGNGLIDGFEFPSPGTDVSFGRTTDGGPTLEILPTATPAAPN